VLTTDARVFDRAVSIGVEHAADRGHRDPYFEELASDSWKHADENRPAPSLVLNLPKTTSMDLLVVLDEGDNQALTLKPPQLLLPAYRLRFYRRAGTLVRLAYGRDDLAPPRYDLALLAPRVLGVTATEAVAAPAEAKAVSAGPSMLTSPWLFWSVLGAAVLILLGFVARLLTKA